MKPILFSMGIVQISSLGFFFLIAFVVATFVMWKKAKEKLFSEEKIFDGFFLSSIGALVGARIAYIIIHFDAFGFHLPTWVFINAYPGFDLFGGLLTMLGIVWVLFYRHSAVPFWDMLDGLTYALVIAYIIGSIGAGLAGVEMGRVTNVSWAVSHTNDSARHHPASWYKGSLMLISLLVLTAIGRKVRTGTGFTALSLLAVFFLTNFLVDFVVVNGVYYGQLNVHQWVSVVSFLAVGIVAYYHAGRAVTSDIKLIAARIKFKRH